MKAGAPPLFLLHADVRFRARVQQAARGGFEVQEVSTWEALAASLRGASPVAVLVADPYAGRGGSDGPAPQLKTLLRQNPFLTSVCAIEARLDRFGDLRTLGEWGVVEVVGTDTHDVLALRRVLDATRGRPMRSLLEKSLPARVTGRGRSILDTAADVAAAGGQPRDLARALFASTRTLSRWCEAEKLPPPRQLLLWIRVLLAAELLEHPGRSIEDVALACGYASDSGLRRALYDSVGTGPRELRQAGAFATAVTGFHALLSTQAFAWPGPAPAHSS